MTMIDPAIVPQRTLYTGAKLPAVGMGTFGSDHADADAVSAAVAGAIRVGTVPLTALPAMATRI